jgi:hypothetical protein
LRNICSPRDRYAEREILVGAYGLTTVSGIVEALVRTKGRGADIQRTDPAFASLLVPSEKTNRRQHCSKPGNGYAVKDVG